MHVNHVKHAKASTEEEKAELTKRLRSYHSAFAYLKEILPTLKKDAAVRDYDVPGWELRQVSVNEYNQAIDDLMKLLTIKE